MEELETITELPLFPLRTVVFPGGRLPLKVFEQRYIDLVRDCVRDGKGFGVCMLAPNDDGPTGIARIGTFVDIEDWFLRDDGLLGITAKGLKRFRMNRIWARDNGLLCAEISWLDEDQAMVPAECSVLVNLLRQIAEQVGFPQTEMTESELDEAGYVSNRLAELLPLELMERQQLLETVDSVERLRKLFIMLRDLQERQTGEEGTPDDA